MISEMVIYLKGKTLQITIPVNSLLQDQEGSVVAGSEAGSKRVSTRLPMLFKANRTMPKWADILKAIG